MLLLCAVGLLATATFHGLPDHVAQTLLRRAPSEVVTRTEHALRALATENPEFVWGQVRPYNWYIRVRVAHSSADRAK